MASSSDDLPPIESTSRICRLGAEDAAAVDRLLADGRGADATPADDREQSVMDLLGLLEDYPVEAASNELVDATVARVARAEGDRERRLSIQNAFEVRGRRIRLPDFFAVAAALLFAVGIGWPLLQTLDANQRRMHSQHRLGQVGQAVAGFAGDSGGWLPFDESVMTRDENGQYPCALGGEHSRHLRMLVDQERLLAGHLYVDESPSTCRALVSYRVVFRPQDFRIDRYRSAEALAGDPNPLIDHLRRHERAGGIEAGSECQEGRGVVVLLFDGSTPYLHSARRTDGDSLWVHDGYDATKGEDQAFRPGSIDDDLLSQ